MALTLAKEADCHGIRPQVIALAQTFAKEKEYLVPEFPARELASVYRIFAILRQDPGSSFLAALDRYLSTRILRIVSMCHAQLCTIVPERAILYS